MSLRRPMTPEDHAQAAYSRRVFLAATGMAALGAAEHLGAQDIPGTNEERLGPALESTSVTELRPGDVLVVKVPGPASEEELENVRTALRSVGLEDVEILVATGDVDLSVLRRTEGGT